MRYIINDDDLKDWAEHLKSALEIHPNSIELKYVIEEIDSEINNPNAFKVVETEIDRLKAMLFHFTGKME